MFSKINIKDIKIEETSHSSGSRKMIVSKNQTTSKYFEAMTYGFLPSGSKWDLHEHLNIVEICIVVKGAGLISNEKGETAKYNDGDRFIFPSNTKHEIENNSDTTSEFYFIRFQDK